MAREENGARRAQQAVEEHRDEGSTELFGITDLCREFGISARAIRFYEDKGLLAPRRVNGTRVYTRRDRNASMRKQLNER